MDVLDPTSNRYPSVEAGQKGICMCLGFRKEVRKTGEGPQKEPRKKGKKKITTKKCSGD